LVSFWRIERSAQINHKFDKMLRIAVLTLAVVTVAGFAGTEDDGDDGNDDGESECLAEDTTMLETQLRVTTYLQTAPKAAVVHTFNVQCTLTSLPTPPTPSRALSLFHFDSHQPYPAF
jgi:hypothetical protein